MLQSQAVKMAMVVIEPRNFASFLLYNLSQQQQKSEREKKNGCLQHAKISHTKRGGPNCEIQAINYLIPSTFTLIHNFINVLKWCERILRTILKSLNNSYLWWVFIQKYEATLVLFHPNQLCHFLTPHKLAWVIYSREWYIILRMVKYLF